MKKEGGQNAFAFCHTLFFAVDDCCLLLQRLFEDFRQGFL